MSLAGALKRLSRLNEAARTKAAPAEAALDQAFALAEDARGDARRIPVELDADPRELERKEERLFTLRAAARKYGGAGRRFAAHA